jgi:hypothetical protein
MPHPAPRLGRIIVLDACAGFATAAPLILAAPWVAGLTGLPPGFLRAVGLALSPLAAFMLATGLGRLGTGWPVAAVIWGNVAWVVASVALLAGLGGLAPNALGTAFILAQAAVVAAFAFTEARAAGQRSLATT